MSQLRNIAAEVMEASEESADGLGAVAAVEVIAADVVVVGTVAQHVERGGEHRSSDGEDGFLGATPCLDAQELGAQVAGLDTHGGPGCSDQGGLDPGAAFSHPAR